VYFSDKSQANEKNCNKIKEAQPSNSQQTVTKTDNSLLPTRGTLPTKTFSILFLKRIDAKFYPKASQMSNIHGISVSNDNLIWVNHLGKCVQFLNT
jgi:hypothetical protein